MILAAHLLTCMTLKRLFHQLFFRIAILDSSVTLQAATAAILLYQTILQASPATTV